MNDQGRLVSGRASLHHHSTSFKLKTAFSYVPTHSTRAVFLRYAQKESE